MAAPDFSITDVVGRGVNFGRDHWRAVAGVLALNAVVGGLNIGLDFADREEGNVFGLFSFVVSIMAAGALLRLAFQRDQPGRPDFRIGPQGLQWRGPEWRLTGAALLLLLVFFLMSLALIFVLVLFGVFLGLTGVMSGIGEGASADQIAERLGPGAAGGLALMLLAFLVAVLWLAVRLALYSPATVAQGRIQLFATYSLTKGRFWKLLGTIVLASLPTIVAGLVAGGVVQVLGQAQVEDGPKIVALPVGLGLGFAVGAVASFVQLPLISGVYAELYRKLAGGVPAEPATARGTETAQP
jgi:hypothetical protein